MVLSDFTIILTDDCNFNCSYCYQKKGQQYLDFSHIKKAIDFFSPFFKDRIHISFYGGEPLLAFEQIERTVYYISEKIPKKEVKYALTTNGNLIDEKILRFFDLREFSLRLSFDGILQDICRQKGTSGKMLAVLRKMLKHPGIEFDTNSVFTPGTIKNLAESVRFIIECDVPDIQFSLDTTTPWEKQALRKFEEEMRAIKEILIPIYKKNGSVPVLNFRKGSHRGLFACFAGKTRMALTPEAKLWGCFLFWDYFKAKENTRGYNKYCFGSLDSFMKDWEKIYPVILSHYGKLRMDHYCTADKFCMLCDEMEECMVCPIDAALSGAVIGNVPDFLCKIKRIEKRVRELFWEELEN